MKKSCCCPSVCALWNTSIGKKIIVAVTGILLVGFLIGHASGNLLLFLGQEALNSYAEFLHHMVHGVGIWIARLGILLAFVLHLVATVQLTVANRAARPLEYEKPATVQASRSSRIMIWSGFTILAFVIYHLLHYTVKIQANLANLPPDAEGRFDVYSMVIIGFSSWPATIFYLIAVSLLCSHLSHGIASIFQTLGLRTKRNAGLIQMVGRTLAFLIWAAFVVVPLSVISGLVHLPAAS